MLRFPSSGAHSRWPSRANVSCDQCTWESRIAKAGRDGARGRCVVKPTEDLRQIVPALMTNRLEDRIRDYLATQLDLLEAGLRLFATEYVLPNAQGAGGRIDIVAKDRFGHFVVIEVKRSETSARQALHEIHKYTALFRSAHGLGPASVRLMVVSTHWVELLLPLSECVESFPYSVEGFSIDVDPTGIVTRAERLALVPSTAAIAVSREQVVFLFRTLAVRNDALASLAEAARSVRLRDFFLISLDYLGNPSSLECAHAVYLVFASPLTGLTPENAASVRESLNWDSELDSPEENFLVALIQKWRGHADSVEIGFPEKLTNLRATWHAIVSYRAGRFAKPESPLDDSDLLALAQSIRGGSGVYLCRVLSPRFGRQWAQLLLDVELVLRGMPHWVSAVAAYLDEVATGDPRATVSVALHNPANLLMTLHSIAAREDYSHCPHLEVVVEHEETLEIRILSGVLTWSQVAVAAQPEELVSSVYGSLERWLFAVHFHETFQYEASALAAHGLVPIVVEFCSRLGEESPPSLLELSGRDLQRTPFDFEKFGSVAEFASSNNEYLVALMALIDSHASGLQRAQRRDESAREAE